jgi:hypothetical protein
MRFGYEVAAPEWLLYAVHLDTDFRQDLVVAPHLDAALPTLAFLPLSFAAGVGLPIRVTGAVEVGVRAQLTAQMLPLAFVVSFDVFPGRSADLLETTLFGQISL